MATARNTIIHPDAQAEYDHVKHHGNYSQRSMVALAWTRAKAACLSNSVKSMNNVVAFPQGRVFSAEEWLGAYCGKAVVGKPSHASCLQVLAADATGNSWMNGPSAPEARAASRL